MAVRIRLDRIHTRYEQFCSMNQNNIMFILSDSLFIENVSPLHATIGGAIGDYPIHRRSNAGRQYSSKPSSISSSSTTVRDGWSTV